MNFYEASNFNLASNTSLTPSYATILFVIKVSKTGIRKKTLCEDLFSQKGKFGLSSVALDEEEAHL